MNKIIVSSLDKKFKPEAKKISAKVRKIFLLLKRDGYSADIYLAGDKIMRKLNKNFRNKNKATNVLSFCEPKNFVNAPSKHNYLGEIYIGPNFIKTHKQDINLMVVHGVLHLFGFDHVVSKDRKRMEKEEIAILSKLN